MANLPKQILNYFATFTETRFNFKRLINYRWTDNEFTLDLSLYPDFQRSLLDSIRNGVLADITIAPGQHTLAINKEELISSTEIVFQKNLSVSKLQQLFDEEIRRIKEAEQADNSGMQKGEEIVWREATRSYNLKFRKELESVVVSLQEKILIRHKEENGATSFPPSSFGFNNYLKNHFDALQSLAQDQCELADYIAKVEQYFHENLDDIVLYDLFYNLQSYAAFAPMGTLYLFFHTIGKEENKFPLYFLETDMRLSNTEITLSFPRNLLLLNVPAINSFKFERVLTTPRASSIEQASAHIGAVEVFLQTQYGHHQSFMLEPQFREVIHNEETFPSISGRIGFQIVTNEDKKLLDYSEIMTMLEQGGHSRFGDFVDGYISGTVPNYQEEVDRTFQERYPLSSPKRYMADGPIPLNNSQKRILLALKNSKNKMIVVDGPPGTGKSHTIAALAYQANEEDKSVVITSHKQEALDVIDRMLTDKYKLLHPQAKPSIVRMDRETGSANNFHNTLQSTVIGAATERTLEYNEKAIREDATELSERLEKTLALRIATAEYASDVIRDLITFARVNEELSNKPMTAAFLSTISKLEKSFDTNLLAQFIDSSRVELFSTTSFAEYAFIVSRKSELPRFLEACEHINDVPADVRAAETTLASISEELTTFVRELGGAFKHNAPLAALSPKNTSSGIFAKLIGKAIEQDCLEVLAKETRSLKYSVPLAELVRVAGKNEQSATVGDLIIGLERAEVAIALRGYKTWIEEYEKLEGNAGMTISGMFSEVDKYQDHLDLFTEETLATLTTLFSHYGELLSSQGIRREQLSTLNRLEKGDTKEKAIFQWITLHARLSNIGSTVNDFTEDASRYASLRQKELEHKNDLRLKELNQHLGIMQQLKVSFDGGKRFTREQTEVLLRGISVIIAEPATLSRHFPMQEDLIDVLIIDEASQVSIADSISLILRAKQVVIFGDEYQYGAVSAINVSTKYSASYFAEIINAYADDYKVSVSEKAMEELVREVVREVSDDDIQSDTLIRPQDNPGAVLWLKTFNIRTSTLAFAKAIANYTTSLKEHFRSFPEIIGYSNEFFYKPAQQELIVNRIRTKPIGETLRFISVKSKGRAGQNTNLDEIDAIIADIQTNLQNGFKGTIGIIASFKEQQARLEEALNERTNLPVLRRDHKIVVWFVGDVQGEERDIVYYSFVEDQSIQNADLRSIYPVIGGTADSIRSLKMQRLNVGFSRAKDTMVFVHSQDIEKYSTTRLGDALKHYRDALESAKKNDFFVPDESIFGSPKEKELYQMLLNTDFVKKHHEYLRIIPQFPIGNYLRAEFAAQIPKYRTDFLLVLSEGGKEETLILEYDGLEFHFKDPSEVSRHALSREFTDYDNGRTLELESYGYRFLRINTFTLRPEKPGDTPIMVLNRLLASKFSRI